MELEHGLKKVRKQTNNTGIYILEIKLLDTFNFIHSRLGNYKLVPGYYYYIGSAQRNLKKRIDRHLSVDKKKHWHIDYLTTNKIFSISRIFVLENLPKESECKLVREIEQNFNIEFPIKSFGNSDCNLCKSHLLFSRKTISYNHFCSLYQSAVIFIPSSNDTF